MAQVHPLFALSLELREVLGDAVLQAEGAVLHQAEEGGRGGDHLGEGSQVEQGLGEHRLARGDKLGASEGPVENRLAVPRHKGDGSRHFSLRNRPLQEGGKPFQAIRGRIALPRQRRGLFHCLGPYQISPGEEGVIRRIRPIRRTWLAYRPGQALLPPGHYSRITRRISRSRGRRGSPQ